MTKEGFAGFTIIPHRVYKGDDPELLGLENELRAKYRHPGRLTGSKKDEDAFVISGMFDALNKKIKG